MTKYYSSKADGQPSPLLKNIIWPYPSVNNIKNAISLILDREKVQYLNWVELFETHAYVFNVLDHIYPTFTRPTDISESMWKRLDSIVKQ